MNTIALNMIVGSGDDKDLRRCLESFKADEFFDEIVIVNTCEDEKINVVANDYKATLLYFEWRSERFPFGNFGGARNVALDNTKSDYVMWLDCDDVCLEKHQKNLIKLRDSIRTLTRDIKYFSIPYDVLFDEMGNPTATFLKERIFKRCDLFRWSYPVHEQVIQNPEFIPSEQRGVIENFAVSHLGSKPGIVSGERNLKILEHEYAIHGDGCETAIKFFYGRDLLLAGNKNKGVEVLSNYINELNSHVNNLYAASVQILQHYAYAGYKDNPRIEDLQISKSPLEIESWGIVAVTLSKDFAEPYCILGDFYLLQRQLNKAEQCYKIALGKECGKSTNVNSILFYEKIPAERLSLIYESRGEDESALFYLSRALLHCPNEDVLLHRRDALVQKIYKKTFTKEGLTNVKI